MSFKTLGLTAELLRAVEKQGYETATPIQQQVIPLILEGRDVLASAQTGTGKTAGFVLPILKQMQADNTLEKRQHVRALILTPTRELGAQVFENIRDYGRFLPFKSMLITGGVSMHAQIEKLRRHVDIVVATPGRLLDLARQRVLDLSHVEFLVLDEADRMLDMGFIRDIRKILDMLPTERQSLLFSATFSKEIKQLAAQFLKKPALVQVARENSTAEKVEQSFLCVDKGRKRELLSHMIGAKNWQQVLVFTRTRRGADRLARDLVKDGLDADAIHGDKTQAARTKALSRFKSGKVRVLVATDVAARGLDIAELPHVVNYDLPEVPEDYVHRIGRTARAGKGGNAVSLVSADEQKQFRRIERVLQNKIHTEIVEGYEPQQRASSNPAKKPRPRRPGTGQAGRKNSGRPGSANTTSGPRKPSRRRAS